MACFGIRCNCQSVLCSQSRPIRVTRLILFCIGKHSLIFLNLLLFKKKLSRKKRKIFPFIEILSLLLINYSIKHHHVEEEEEQVVAVAEAAAGAVAVEEEKERK